MYPNILHHLHFYGLLANDIFLGFIFYSPKNWDISAAFLPELKQTDWEWGHHVPIQKGIFSSFPSIRIPCNYTIGNDMYRKDHMWFLSIVLFRKHCSSFCALLSFFLFAAQNVHVMAGALAAILGYPALDWQCRELWACIPMASCLCLHYSSLRFVWG